MQTKLANISQVGLMVDSGNVIIKCDKELLLCTCTKSSIIKSVCYRLMYIHMYGVGNCQLMQSG